MSEHLFTQFLLSVLSMAFFAWAGVLYKGISKVMDRFDFLNRSITNSVNDLRKEVNEHMLATEKRLAAVEAAMSLKGE